MSPSVCVKVWGEYAVFTRPELKVERLSYPVMTPSAARGVLDAILFRPQMAWNVQRITVLKAVQWASFRRNEIQGKIAPRAVAGWMKDPATFEPYLVDSAGREGAGGQNRTQRNTLALREVEYLIHATPVLTPLANRPRKKPPGEDEPQGEDTVIKYVSMFNRRVARGQRFQRPYLGCREFACSFAPPTSKERSIDWDDGLGLMLYDVYYGGNGENLAGFFDARVRGGVMHCDRLTAGPGGEAPVVVHGWPAVVGRESEGATS